jgi:hypothetical protein
MDAASHLTCEYLENPIGLDEAAPRFAWRMESDAPLTRAGEMLRVSAEDAIASVPDSTGASSVRRSRESA